MTSETEPPSVIIVVDPGRAKCGVAVVSGPSPVACLHKAVVETMRLTLEVNELRRRFPAVERLVIGSGTGSAPLRRALKSTFPDLPIEIIDEYRSSERARRRFLEENVPVGWRRLVPSSLRTPDRPYDDVVAVILAEDYFLQSARSIDAT